MTTKFKLMLVFISLLCLLTSNADAMDRSTMQSSDYGIEQPVLFFLNTMFSIGNTIACVPGHGDWVLGSLGVLSGIASFVLMIPEDHVVDILIPSAVVSTALGGLSIALNIKGTSRGDEPSVSLVPTVTWDEMRSKSFGAELRIVW
jgi:hypothetical protein